MGFGRLRKTVEQDVNIDFCYDFKKCIGISLIDIIRYIADGFRADKEADLYVYKNGSRYRVLGVFLRVKQIRIYKKGDGNF